MTESFVALPGSARTPPPSWTELPARADEERIEISIRVPRRPGVELPSVEALGALPPGERRHLSREELTARYGADPAALAAVERHARERGITVVDACPSKRRVLLAGTLGELRKAFPADVRRVEHPSGHAYRQRCGDQHVPAALAGCVEGLFGFSSQPRARPYVTLPAEGDAGAPNDGSHLPGDLARLYDFPPDLDGRGECIGILEFGGGYRDSDLQAYFAKLGLPCPEVVAVPVGGRTNAPGVSRNLDVEVALDLQIAGAIAPGARLAAYFCEWTEKGWIDALETAIHDRDNQPSILSISWGWAELEAAGHVSWTEAAIDAVNTSLQEAALLGITILCASGDDGSAAGIAGDQAHVDFPASSPYVLSCGGTTLRATSAAMDEVTWNEGARTPAGGGATGGGVSELNPLPTWQASAGVPTSLSTGRQGRGVPDIAGNADRASGYTILVDGQELRGVGGTSAVAPLYAGLLARINQRLGRPVGYLNPLLYEKLAPAVFRDVIVGGNGCAGAGGYQAGKDWDACTGWGSIVGSRLLLALLDEAPSSAESAEGPPSHVDRSCSPPDALPRSA